jgi:hypothetical protein
MTQTKKTRKARSPARKSQAGLPTLAALLKHLKLKDTDWDALIIGDGSGSSWKQGAGWAAVLIDKASRARKLFYGAMNTGTVTLGELFPYLHALSWYTGNDGPGKHRRRELARVANRAMQIHIVSDSQIIVTAGNHPESRRSHAELWTAFNEFSRRGFEQTFHYIERDCVDLNILVDEISRSSRQALEPVFGTAVTKLARRYIGLPDDVTIYDFSS